MARSHSPDFPPPGTDPFASGPRTSGNGPGLHERHEASGGRSVPALLGDLVRELRTLVGNEVQLARTEISERIHQAQAGAGSLGAAAVISLAGLVILLQAATLGLDLWIQEPWLSALIVGAVALLIGLVLASVARKQLKPENLTPRRTAESLQRDADLVRRDHRPDRAAGFGLTREEVR